MGEGKGEEVGARGRGRERGGRGIEMRRWEIGIGRGWREGQSRRERRKGGIWVGMG